MSKNEIDQIVFGYLSIAACVHAVPVRVKVVLVALAAAVCKPRASLGHWVVEVTSSCSLARPDLTVPRADVAWPEKLKVLGKLPEVREKYYLRVK